MCIRDSYSPDAIPDKELLEELHQHFKPVIDEDISVTEHCSPFTLEDLIEFYYSEQPYKWLKENELNLVDITHQTNGRTSTHMDIKETDKLIYGRCKFTPTRYGRRVRDDGKKMRQSFRFHAANIKGISYRFPHQSKSPQLDLLLESLKSKGEVLKDVDIRYPVHPPRGFYSIGRDFLYKDLIWTFLSSGNDDDPEKLDQSYILIFYPKDK